MDKRKVDKRKVECGAWEPFKFMVNPDIDKKLKKIYKEAHEYMQRKKYRWWIKE